MKKLSDITFGELAAAYEAAAGMEWIASSSPAPSTVRNNIESLAHVLPAAGLTPDAPVSALDRKRLEECVLTLERGGIRPVSIRSAMQHLNALFAPWTRPYYSKVLHLGAIPQKVFDTPRVRVPPQRYSPPRQETLSAVKEWYAGLSRRATDGGDGAGRYLAATFMLEFAVRNGDVLRLKWDNIRNDGQRAFLRYTPNKTALSSGRVVCWPIHSDILKVLDCVRRESRSELIVPDGARHLDFIRREMRRIGFCGTKSAYELRKICIHHVYLKFGAEMATSISGDDIRTILKYYADPSAPNIGDMRVIDLF